MTELENKKILGLIGIATKAGKTVSGSDKTVESIRFGKRNKVKLVVCSGDASDTTMKRIRNTTDYYKVPLVILDTDKSGLAAMVGNPDGANSVVGITDFGFAKAILKNVPEKPDNQDHEDQ